MDKDSVSTDDLLFHDSKSDDTGDLSNSNFTSASHGVVDSDLPQYTKIDIGGKSPSLTTFPQPSESDDDGDKTELLEGHKKEPSFWTFEYYQAFFDVDTYQVLRRISGSMFPNPKSNYLRLHIRPNPDLYGPFWICTTLVFTTAICGNLANYISCGRYDYEWRYDFHKVTFAAAAIFAYWWLIPCGIFGLLWWRGNPAGYTFMEIICVYGYSLAIYIPVSILWVIPFTWLQLVLVLLGMVLSGSVLLFTFWPAVREDVNKKVAWITMVVIFIFHGALAAGFVLYFFHVPESTCSALLKPTVPALTPTIAVIINPSHKPTLNNIKLTIPKSTEHHSVKSVSATVQKKTPKTSVKRRSRNVVIREVNGADLNHFDKPGG